MHVTVDDINFCDGLECVYVSTKAVHQRHMNCLINTLVFASLKAVYCLQHSFLCNDIYSYTKFEENAPKMKLLKLEIRNEVGTDGRMETQTIIHHHLRVAGYKDVIC